MRRPATPSGISLPRGVMTHPQEAHGEHHAHRVDLHGFDVCRVVHLAGEGYFPRLAAGEALPRDMSAVYGAPANAKKLEALLPQVDYDLVF